MDFDTISSLSKQIALVIFFALFVAILAWVYWPGHKKRLEDHARDALNDEDDQRSPRNDG